MKYVLMYTNRPDLDAAVPEERQAEVYQAIYGWFEKHGAVMVDGGAELQGPETATSVKSGTNGRRASRSRRALLRGQGERRGVQHHRRSQLGCGHRDSQGVAIARAAWRGSRDPAHRRSQWRYVSAVPLSLRIMCPEPANHVP